MTKAVVFCDRAIFGFTGYAEVDTKRSDLWIADQLKDVQDLGDGFEQMRSRLTDVFRRPRYRGGHSVTAAGFKIEPDGSLLPYYAIVTNQFKNGRWLDKPETVFSWLVEIAPPGAVGVFAAPGWLDDVQVQELRSRIAAVDTLDAAVEAVVAAIRGVAAAHDEVGSDLMLSILPKSSVGRKEVLLLTGGPPGDTPTFHYLPADGDPVQYGPTFVCGGSVMADLTVRPLKDEDRENAAEETREFHRRNRPQHAYVVRVSAKLDPTTGESVRSPDVGTALSRGSYLYHPTEDIALVLTPDELDGFRELTTLQELIELQAHWGEGSFEVHNVSEVTGIGWSDE